MLLHRGTFSNL